MNKKNNYIILTLVTLSLASCAAPLIVGGGAFVGTLATREKGITGTATDSEISIALKAKLNTFNPDLCNAVGISVHEGKVLLTGTVTEAQWQLDAEKIAWETKGVKVVNNHLELSGKENEVSAVQDGLITTQIKTKIFFDKDTRSLNYSVKTVNGVTYIMGIAQNKEELERVTAYASATNGVKKVISYVRLKDEIDS